MDSPTSFRIVGTVAGEAVTIEWARASGFDDPSGRTETMIRTCQQVCGTATGPCYDAAAKPAVVAWLTAKQALYTIESWDVGGDALEAELVSYSTVPDGATP